MNEEEKVEWAQQIAQNLRHNRMMVLPNTRGDNGDYLWDFRVEGGDSSQGNDE